VTAPGGTTDPSLGNNSATDTDTAAPSADLAITKSHSPSSVTAGDTLTYTVKVTNNGPSDAQNVVASDTLSSDLTFVSTSGCTNDPNGAPTCNLGTIASGGSASYTITTTVNLGVLSGTTISNTATVSSDTSDPNSGNNTTSPDTIVTTVFPQPPIVISQQTNEVSWTASQGAIMYHLYRGDLSGLQSIGQYTQDPSSIPSAQRFCWLSQPSQEDAFVPAVGQAVFYLYTTDDGATEGSLGQDSAGRERPNDHPCR
jgi:uncharacterized repeat protein (TIGR01451 family)